MSKLLTVLEKQPPSPSGPSRPSSPPSRPTPSPSVPPGRGHEEKGMPRVPPNPVKR